MIKASRWEDHYTRRSRDERWLARSVYKLEEADRRFKLIRKGDYLLDLGCYPGSWVQYGLKIIGPQGELVGVDLLEPSRLIAPNFRFIKADVLKLDLDWLVKEISPRDVVLSDMAPNTTGIRVADTCRSMELSERALDIALVMLRKKGHFLCKIFEGEGFKAYRETFSSHFGQVRLLRPSAVRKGSREVYLLGLNLVK
ncbi:MAG: RlmE family RNA methyltransferase [Pseudomonadota bacterium]